MNKLFITEIKNQTDINIKIYYKHIIYGNKKLNTLIIKEQNNILNEITSYCNKYHTTGISWIFNSNEKKSSFCNAKIIRIFRKIFSINK